MKKWMKTSLWVLGGLSFLAVLITAWTTSVNETLDAPEISIHVEGESAFLTEKELELRLQRLGLIYPDQKRNELKVQEVEAAIRQMNEVRDAEVFLQLGKAWRIDVELRRPLARIFNQKGESFYLDAEGNTMLPSNLHTARVLVVNGAIPDNMGGPNVDSLENNPKKARKFLLDNLYYISKAIADDSFLSAQIAQVHVEANGELTLIPQVGGHLLRFGQAKSHLDVYQKFEKLKVFYRHGMPYAGWRKYDEISLKFKDQIVCKQKPSWL